MYIRALCLSLVLVVEIKVNVSAYCCLENRSRCGDDFHNASTNRKFLTDCLCDGQLKTHITDPLTGQPIFLIFDPLHDLKNVYNNFHAVQKTVRVPINGF